MSSLQNRGYDPMSGEEELQGPERYLRPGEELLVYTPDIQIKKFRFDAYLTNTRLFLTDQDEKAPGVTAKEIPLESVADTYLEHSPSQEPILVLSIRTSDDDLRTMKMVFVHTGTDRLSQAEEWMHLIKHGHPKAPTLGTSEIAAPVISAEARALSETMILPEKTRVEKAVPPQQEIHTAPLEEIPRASREAFSQAKPTRDATITQIQFCFHCGHRLPPNANFCPYCGTRMHQANAPSNPRTPPQPTKMEEEVRTPREKEKKKGLGWLFKRK